MKLNRQGRFMLVLALVLVFALSCAALIACQEPLPEPQTGDEAGAYYYDAGADEYSVVLGEGMQFTLSVNGAAIAGKYTLDNGALTLTPNKQDENPISATLKDNVITLTFNGAQYRFLKKVNFTVSFESNGGSAVSGATVVNGKKVIQPADPVKDGFVFVGWYQDSSFSIPFSFNSQIITSNITLYARWAEKQVGSLEFTVKFDAANDGVNPEPRMTVSGGKLYNLPVVEKAGYTFKGWWVSMNGDGALSYEYTEDMALDADTTLHAVWQSDNLGSKLADPLVNVDANTIKWNNVGAREYLLQVKDADGNYIIDKTLGGTVESVNFADYPAGDYTVTVTAVAASGEANNAVCTRLYKNKALARVSKFNVIDPATLLFNAVDNAEKYLIKVSCGDENHNHNQKDVFFDNGTSTHFNFSDCQMGENGISFTVYAVADGFASSQSEEYPYAPKLDAVTDFVFDEETQILKWNHVANATGYMVSVKCGNGALSEEFVNIGAVNSICLKECSNVSGGIVVKVYPVSQMFISPAEASYTFNKQNLATPQNIRIQGTTVSWDAVAGASSYDVRIAGATINATTNSVNLAGKVALTERENYTLTVTAKGSSNSIATDPVDARNLAMADAIKYNNGVLSWAFVIGAAKYDVQVNDEAVFSVTGGVNFTSVKLSQAGVNTLKVRFLDENNTAFEWVSLEVFAHTVTFVSDGGSSVDEQFKAVGDSLEMPQVQKEGYSFLDWYNSPKGPESNGAAFKDTVFKASGDLVLYACYKPKEYTVTYHYGEGGSGVEPSDVAYYQQHYSWKVPQANDATGAFGGWFSAPNGNGVQYTDDKGVSLNPWNKLENADVYAFWFDDVLSFTLTQNSAGRQIYAVMQGSRISQVSEVTVPETYKGIKVGMLSGNAFKGCSNLVTLNIPDTLEIISDVDPFTDCSSLSAINVYKVKGNNSIRYWSADGVLFDNGRLDQQPSDPSQIKSAISYMPLGKTGSYTIPDGIVEIPTLAFAGSALTRVVVPASVVNIGMEAFKGCTNLTTVVFDSGSRNALTIGDGAFSGCTALVNITLPARLASISLTKYELLRATGSPAAQEVSLDTGVTNAFVGCKNLQNVYIASGNAAYASKDGIIYSANGSQLLYCLPSVQGDVVIPEGVSSIANGAFIGCSSITGVTIPSTILSVGECAFYNTDIKAVTFKGLTIGNTDVTIGKYAFRGCDDLASVTFEQGNRVANIGDGAFYGCSDLTSIALPVNLKKVGAQAFRDCNYITEVDMSAVTGEVVFGSDAFYNCSRLGTLTLPKNVKELPGIFGGCSALTQVTVDENNQYFTSIDGVLFDKGVTTLLFYPQSRTDSTYAIPDTVTTISDGIFAGNGNLESITIGKNVTKIGDGAFRESALSEIIFEADGTEPLEIGAYAFYELDTYNTFSVSLPDRTKKVGEYAFAENRYLSSFTFNEGLEEVSDYMLYNAQRISVLNIPASVTRIGKSAFYNCGYQDDTLALTFAENSQLKVIDDGAFEDCASYNYGDLAVVLPQGLQRIGKNAFGSAGFTDITIPNSVTVIGYQAFARNSKLKNVTFTEGGTEDLVFAEDFYSDWNGEGYANSAFYRCSGLLAVQLPERLTFLGNRAFYDCSKLASVSFGVNSRLQYIGEYAFNSTVISEITVPSSVANGTYVIDENGTQQFRVGIGKNAFASTSKLVTINFAEGGNKPLSIGDQAFYTYESIETINLPARLSNYVDADGNLVNGISEKTFSYLYSDGTSSGQSSTSTLSAINVAAGCKDYCSQDGILYTADKKTLIICPVNKTDKIVIPAEVTLIGTNAFAFCKASEIEFTGGEEDMIIDERAFYGCKSITEIVLSDNVVELKDNAFGNCEALKTFTLSANMSGYNPNAFSQTQLTAINVSQNNKDITSEGGVIFNKDKTVLISYPSTLTAESYTVPATVKEIGARAFDKNINIKSVALPAGLIKIGDLAFSGCTHIANITIPNTVENIGKQAFYICYELGELTFEKGGTSQLVIEDNAFDEAGITVTELPARLTALGSNAFHNNSSLITLTFEQGSKLDSIGSGAFWNTGISEISLPAGLGIIGDNVFYGCSSLVSVTFGDGLREIGDATFSGCSSLESVTFPASLKTMGAQTFAENNSLKFVSFGQNSQLEMLVNGTFYNCKSLERFVIPANVKVLEGALYGDYGLESGYRGVFEGCTSLKSVTFEEGSKCSEIGNNAFYGCSALESFTIPSAVSSLGISAFEGCSSIREIVIPSTAAIYQSNLFRNCTSLERVTLNDKATALPNGMFYNCSALKQIVIPASVTSFGEFLFDGAGFETFTVPSNITVLPRYFLSDCKSLVSVVLPEGLQVIGSAAFESCTALKQIVLPAGVTEIGENAFKECSALASVTLSENLETIGQSAFESCSSLTSITVPSKVTLIDYYAFENCYKLVEVINKSSLEIDEYHDSYIGYYAQSIRSDDGESIIKTNADGLQYIEDENGIKALGYVGTGTQLVLPDNTVAIYEYAFASSNLVSVTIPASVTLISESAFADCANLTTVIIQGQVTAIKQNAFVNCVKLANITLPDSITKIERSAFENCSSLESIVLPANLTSFGYYAFRGCAKLKSVVIPNGVTQLNGNAFANCTSLQTVTLPTSLSSMDSYSFPFSGCTSLTSYAFDGECSNYKAVNGVLYNAAGTKLISVPFGMTGTYVMPKEVTSIDRSAFEGSQLDMLMFESGRESKLSVGYSDYWLKYATVKAVVISLETFSYMSYPFEKWLPTQTVYFVESKEEIDNNFYLGTVGATVVYNYQVPDDNQ